MLKRFCFLLLGLLATQAYAQNVWRDIAETNIPESGERRIIPQRFRTVELDASALQSILQSTTARFANRSGADQQQILSLPLPDGGSARFRLFESPVMAAGLQARYPSIRSYTGYGLDDPSALLKCDWTPWGFHAMLSSARHGTIFIDPYSHGNTDFYTVYNKKDYVPAAKEHRFSCGVQTEETSLGGYQPIPQQSVSSRSHDGNMRQYRLALACTGEYASFHGGTKPLVLAAMVTSINRVNSVYEREFSVNLQIINGNDTLIFLNAGTDPYTNNSGGTMLGQNQTTCNNRVGAANYDMGHVFSTGGGGIAGLGVICTNGKARGVTGQAAPIGDPFDIDYVAHEMGHQFSGNHTQNNSCNRYGPTAMEPGSASTIMGYAGICAPNVQSNSDDYFHGVSVEEIVNFIHFDSGNNCALKIPTGNTPPTVNAGPDYTIPKSTPFALRAAATDPDSADVLTYCWEQMDNESGSMPPLPTNTLGPMFRSYDPDTVATRYFPRLSALLFGIGFTWERLPSVGRKMDFRVTVRDNNPAGGQIDQDDMVVTVDNNTGPFRVLSPNTAVTWKSGTYQLVTWDVAGSDKAPVSCSTVNIKLSTNSGFTYPITLAAGVPNTGEFCILVPDIESAAARIKVEAVGNVFFDISNKNFKVEASTTPSFSLCIAEPDVQVCLPQIFSTTVSTNAILGLDSPIDLSVNNLPAAAVATFTPNPVMPGASAQLDIDFPNGLSNGNLNIGIQGVVGMDTVIYQTNLDLISNDFEALTLLAPANGATGLNQAPVLYWQSVADADAYDLEIATYPTFEPDSIAFFRENILADSLKISVLLDKSQVYYWRVRPKNECGSGAWVGPFAFATLLNSCTSFEAGDLPKNITGSLAITVESKITVLSSAIISDVNVANLQGNHEFFKDLEVDLISPAGTKTRLFKDKCGSFSGNFKMGFDDNGLSQLSCPPPNNGTIFQPVEAFSAFNGEDAIGDWTLRVRDNVISSGGIIQVFNLEICSDLILNPPVIVNNNTLQVDPGNNKLISTDFLKSEDIDNSDDELVYTLMNTPENGALQLFWNGDLTVGAQFTQADLNNDGLRYFDYGFNAGADQFCFTVADGTGGMAQDCFHIQPLPVGTNEPGRTLSFTVAPNPATDVLRISFGTALLSDARVQLLDMAGRVLQSKQLASGQFASMLNVSSLPEGLYVIAVESAEGLGVRKVVVR